jgi:uncharacterized protein (DUF2252 family)
LLEESNQARLPELAPIRYGRMLETPFAFFRGAPIVMANDLARTPVTGLRVQACGDAHLLNFGAFASPERTLVFDLNDFDETLPGPWEWDVKRLAASVVVAGRVSGKDDPSSREAASAAVRTYRQTMAELAGKGVLDTWYARVDAATLIESAKGRTRRLAKQTLNRARRHTSVQALPKLTEVVGQERRIVDDPPLVTHVAEEGLRDRLVAIFLRYRASLSEDRQGLLERFRFVDFARKVVGVGSVGTGCYIVLLEGEGSDDPLFVQIKEAQASVLEAHVGRSTYRNHGKRVVVGQRSMQAASDIFLGWTSDGDRDYYVRQLRDMKGSVVLEVLDQADLLQYAGLCGGTLAQAHARTGDAAAIAGYLGGSDRFDGAVVAFAEAYAAQTERDHAALAAAVAAGRIAAEPVTN